MLSLKESHRLGPLRALVIVAAAMLPAACKARAGQSRERAVLEELSARAERANAAFINGDMRRWYDIVGPIAEDFTLMQPSGGVSHGFDPSPGRLDQLARTFTRGEATFELVQSYIGEDMAVLVFIERQRAEVAGLPEQDWSLRVTQVWRNRGGAWELVHRHADTLVNTITMERSAELARTD